MDAPGKALLAQRNDRYARSEPKATQREENKSVSEQIEEVGDATKSFDEIADGHWLRPRQAATAVSCTAINHVPVSRASRVAGFWKGFMAPV